MARGEAFVWGCAVGTGRLCGVVNIFLSPIDLDGNDVVAVAAAVLVPVGHDDNAADDGDDLPEIS